MLNANAFLVWSGLQGPEIRHLILGPPFSDSSPHWQIMLCSKIQHTKRKKKSELGFAISAPEFAPQYPCCVTYSCTFKQFRHVYIYNITALTRACYPFEMNFKIFFGKTVDTPICVRTSQMVALLIYCSLLLWKSRNTDLPFLHSFTPNNKPV